MDAQAIDTRAACCVRILVRPLCPEPMDYSPVFLLGVLFTVLSCGLYGQLIVDRSDRLVNDLFEQLVSAQRQVPALHTPTL